MPTPPPDSGRLRVAVHGATGYLGRLLVHALASHPHIGSITPTSQRLGGEPLGRAVPALAALGLTLAEPSAPAARDADVVFLATGHGEARALVPELVDAGVPLIVDLSRDHRLEAIREGKVATRAGTLAAHYGLADLAPAPKGFHGLVASPGCYPTATLLPLVPLARAGLIEGPISVTGISGVSGAGATPRPDLHFAEVNEAVRAYKVGTHDHEPEMELGLSVVGGSRHSLTFVPILAPLNRGLLAVASARAHGTAEEASSALRAAFEGSPFVSFVDEPRTADVAHTNNATLTVTITAKGALVTRCAIDNLVKGGAGQAIQNMNAALGLPVAAGLSKIGVGV